MGLAFYTQRLMLSIEQKNEWQQIDPELNLLYPWFTNYFLEALKGWDLADKTVFEYGLGHSTAWWAAKAKKVYSIDSNIDWFVDTEEYLTQLDLRDKASLSYTKDRNHYINCISQQGVLFDIVVVDGDPCEWRDDCIEVALKSLKQGGILIVDNYEQPSVYMPSEDTKRRLGTFSMEIYSQAGHKDWQTMFCVKY